MSKPTLRKKYEDECRGALQKEFDYKNVMQIPRVEKVVVNMGMGEAAREPKVMDSAIKEMTQITAVNRWCASHVKALLISSSERA